MAGPAESSSMVIEELTGGRRRLELRGPGLPFKGASWSGDQVIVTTWYPGNSIEANQQVLGPTEAPSEWEGEWHRTTLGVAPCLFVDETGVEAKVVDPFLLADILDDFRIRGPRLRVTWAATVGGTPSRFSRTREGRISTFGVKVDTINDVRWNVKFDWLGRGGTAQRVVAGREGDMAAAIVGLQQTMNDLLAFQQGQNARIVAAQRNVAKSATPITLGQLEALERAPAAELAAFGRATEQLTTQVQAVGGLVTGARAVPAQVANVAIAQARNAVAVANQFHDAMSRRPAELNAAKAGAAELVRSSRYFWRSADLASAIATKGSELGRQAAPAARRPADAAASRTAKSHVVREGETMSLVAARELGSSDRAVDLARANRLPWHQARLVAGKSLVVPPAKGT